MKIITLLKKNSKIRALLRIIKNINDKKFIDNFLEINKDNSNFKLEFHSFGNLFPNKIVSIFDIDDPNTGFFAYYRWVLNFLYISDRFNFIPVINFKSNFLYSETEPVNGSNNPFEYYFERVSDISYESALKSFTVFKYNLNLSYIAETSPTYYSGYNYDNEYLSKIAVINSKYIHLKKNVQIFINDGIQKLLGTKNVLGVHIRGTDFKGNFNNHPKLINIDDYIPVIKKAILDYKFDLLFLATDDQKILEKLLTIFPNIISYYEDVTRSSNELAVGFIDNNRYLHKYNLGLEVLRDMHTLARCQGFICGLSQVSICAQIQKISNGGKFDFLHIIDKGMNKNNHHFHKYINKRK
jgi:hypothetical protein